MRRVTIETTLYGKRLVTYAQLKQLHREVARAASRARWSDPDFVGNQRTGRIVAESKARPSAS